MNHFLIGTLRFIIFCPIICRYAKLPRANALLLSINKMLWHFFLHTIFQRFPAAQKPTLVILFKRSVIRESFR